MIFGVSCFYTSSVGRAFFCCCFVYWLYAQSSGLVGFLLFFGRAMEIGWFLSVFWFLVDEIGWFLSVFEIKCFLVSCGCDWFVSKSFFGKN